MKSNAPGPVISHTHRSHNSYVTSCEGCKLLILLDFFKFLTLSHLYTYLIEVL